MLNPFRLYLKILKLKLNLYYHEHSAPNCFAHPGGGEKRPPPLVAHNKHHSF